MENKDVEEILMTSNMRHPVVIECIEQLEQLNIELQQQLSAKDKALEKACEELETFDMTFNNKDFDDVKSKEEWKEWAENDID